jgi:hypothetical protein
MRHTMPMGIVTAATPRKMKTTHAASRTGLQAGSSCCVSCVSGGRGRGAEGAREGG